MLKADIEQNKQNEKTKALCVNVSLFFFSKFLAHVVM